MYENNLEYRKFVLKKIVNIGQDWLLTQIERTCTHLLQIESQHATSIRLTNMSTGTISALTQLGPWKTRTRPRPEPSAQPVKLFKSFVQPAIGSLAVPKTAGNKKKSLANNILNPYYIMPLQWILLLVSHPLVRVYYES